MFSMAAAGLVKPLIAVTVALNPVAAYHAPGSYTVRPGDTLSTIAARAYGSAAGWPAVWWANRRQVRDPDLITAGERLVLPGSHQVPRWRPGRRGGTACPGGARRHSAGRGDRADAGLQPGPGVCGRGELAGHRGVRIRRQLGRQHRQRLLRRTAVHRADLARLRRRPVRRIGEPGHPGPADRRGPAGPGGPGHRRLARVRGARLIPSPGRHLPAPGSRQRGQAGGAVPGSRWPMPPARLLNKNTTLRSSGGPNRGARPGPVRRGRSHGSGPGRQDAARSGC